MINLKHLFKRLTLGLMLASVPLLAGIDVFGGGDAANDSEWRAAA